MQKINPPYSDDPQKPVHANPMDDPGAVLNHFFDIMVPSGLIFGGIALSVSLFRSFHHGWHKTMMVHIAMYLTAIIALKFRRHLSPYLLLFMMIGLMAVSVVNSLWTMGFASEAMMSLMAICILSGLFLETRHSIMISITGLLVSSLIGILVSSGMISLKPDLLQYLYEPSSWILQISAFFMYTIPLVLIIGYTRKKMMESILSLKKSNEQLEEEIEIKKQMEKELKKSEVRFKNVFENAEEGFFVADQKGNILRINRSLSKLFGFSSEEELKKNIPLLNVFPFTSPRDLKTFYEHLTIKGIVKGFETEISRYGGDIRWVSINAKRIHFEGSDLIEGSITDITQKKLYEKAVFESEQKYRGVVENSLAAFYIEQNHVIQFVNRRFCDITGYDSEEITGRLGIIDFLGSDSEKETADQIIDAVMQEKRQQEFELNLKRKDGKLITAKLYAHSFYYEQKDAIFGTFIDITNVKTMENRLRQSQKMEAIGTLTSGIVHDFSNIITSLSGYGTLLKLEMEDTDPRLNYVKNILSATDKATELTKSLLTYSRFQPTTLKPVQLNSIIRQSKALLKRLISDKVEFREEYAEEEDLTVLADATQMDQILFNLVANAGDSMEKGGTLTLRTELSRIDEPFIKQHGFGKTGPYALLVISDTGSGIDEKIINNIFDPFFTTKEIGKGTGLGLSTVYGIVKQHNGYIFVASEKGKGTAFHVYLPIITERVLQGIQAMRV
ncbi:MAG: PAS domain S-box protein [Proteobacteria bacterium]|nr:PAS domain S-box protein [Pseudomonadota bacterium]MBU4469772.1 PAS domain S-box protein [Pseudomonadota bacterium]MCG2753007.1 PAS domain S-box protein [Desulfobacteraceae bacterium]